MRAGAGLLDGRFGASLVQFVTRCSRQGVVDAFFPGHAAGKIARMRLLLVTLCLALVVADVSGKGLGGCLVTAMVHAALVAAGIPAARFISPHLTDLAERFVIGRDPVAPGDLERAVNDVLDCADALPRATLPIGTTVDGPNSFTPAAAPFD